MCILLGFILYFAIFSVADDCRNRHTPCKIIINEVKLLGIEPFIEIAKFCDGPEINGVLKLSNFQLLLIENDLSKVPKIIQSVRLHDQELQVSDTAFEGITVSANTPRRRHKAGNRRGGPRRILDRSQHVASPGTFDRDSQDAQTQITQERTLKRKRDTNNWNSTRVRRSPQVYSQKNVYYFFVHLLSNFQYDARKCYGIVLLKLPSKEMRADKNQLAIFQISVPMPDLAQKKIGKYTEDHLFLSTTEFDISNFPDDFKIQRIDLFPPDISKSVSICGEKNILIGTHIQTTSTTPWKENKCVGQIDNEAKVVKFKYHFRGEPFDSQTKKILHNLFNALEFYRKNEDLLFEPAISIVHKLTNIGTDYLYKFKKAWKANVQEGIEQNMETPGKKRPKPSPKSDLDAVRQQILYNCVTSEYANNRIPILLTIYKNFKNGVNDYLIKQVDAAVKAGFAVDENFPSFDCSINTFRKTLHRYGYKYGRISNRDRIIFSPFHTEKRKAYIRQLRKYRMLGYEPLYLDETWIDQNSRQSFGWILKHYVDPKQRAEFVPTKSKPSRGLRLMVVAAGGSMGFIKESIDVTQVSQKRSKEEDPHRNMDSDMFTSWMQRLLAAIKETGKKYVIIMDNASYHSYSDIRTSAKKQELLDWIQSQVEKGVEVPQGYVSWTRNRLKDQVKLMKQNRPHHVIDEMVKASGNAMLRLPPYTPELNPIELIWAQLKSTVRKNNLTQLVKDVLHITKVAIATISKDDWLKVIAHVKKIEDEFMNGVEHAETVISQDAEAQRLLTEIAEDEEFDEEDEPEDSWDFGPYDSNDDQ